jgi:glycosyltransferase involved in cell wall biosynthesis
VASSALRFAGGAGAVIRRVPPFSIAGAGAIARFATRMAPAGLLFSTEADRNAADLKNYRVPPSVVPLGLDPSAHDATEPLANVELGAPVKARHIVCVHDGVNKPAVLVALRVVALLAPRFPTLHLTIVGSGRQDELRMHGAALGINSRVTYAGSRDDELAVIRSADVGWVAADADAAAFAALDFMACRTAVLAPRSPLAEHYVADRIAGLLLPDADVSSTAGAVAAFLSQDSQRIAMGNAGRARLERDFALSAMIDGYEHAVTASGDRSAQPA